jgi:hypothetical protein
MSENENEKLEKELLDAKAELLKTFPDAKDKIEACTCIDELSTLKLEAPPEKKLGEMSALELVAELEKRADRKVRTELAMKVKEQDEVIEELEKEDFKSEVLKKLGELTGKLEGFVADQAEIKARLEKIEATPTLRKSMGAESKPPTLSMEEEVLKVFDETGSWEAAEDKIKEFQAGGAQ